MCERWGIGKGINGGEKGGRGGETYRDKERKGWTEGKGGRRNDLQYIPDSRMKEPY